MTVEEINVCTPDKEVIEFLESILEDAKTGRIQSIAIVTSHPDYCTGSAWSGMDKNNMAIIGEIESLKTDLIRYFCDQRVKYIEG